MQKYKAILVDDEALARNRLKRLLAQIKTIELITDAGNPFECLGLIERLKPDLLFLDIQMPGLNGFEMIQQIPLTHLPMIIFITAYDQYALKAFGSLAIDYLLKPVKLEHLEKAVSKLERFENTFQAVIRKKTPKGVDNNPLTSYTKRFVLKYGSKWRIIEEKEAVMFFAEAKFCYLRTRKKDSIINFTLKELESKLDPAVFMRVHRSSIISICCIKNVQSIGSGRFEITLSDGSKIQSSRSYLQNVKRLLSGDKTSGSMIGSSSPKGQIL